MRTINHYLTLLNNTHKDYINTTHDLHTLKKRLPPGTPPEVITLPGSFGHRIRACVARDLAECEHKTRLALCTPTTYAETQFTSAHHAYHTINGSPRGWLT